MPQTTILSEGVGASSGVLVIDEDRKYYHAKTSPDLKATLEQIIAALTAAASGLGQTVTALGTLATSSTDPIGFPIALASISSAQSSITSAKNTLDTLKETLK